MNPWVLRSNNGSDFISAMKECYHLAAKHLQRFSWFRDLIEVKRRKSRKRREVTKVEVEEKGEGIKQVEEKGEGIKQVEEKREGIKQVEEKREGIKHLQKDAFEHPVNPRVWQPHPAETFSNSAADDPLNNWEWADDKEEQKKDYCYSDKQCTEIIHLERKW